MYATRAYKQAKRQKTTDTVTPARPAAGNNQAEETPSDKVKMTEEGKTKRKLDFPDQ